MACTSAGRGCFPRGANQRKISLKNGKTMWRPLKAGLEFSAVPAAALPGTTKQARQLQIKHIARQFSAKMLGWKQDKSEQEVLRLLPRALYVYALPTPECLAGAVFGFTSGTDPEALLVLEAVRVGDEYRWEFGLVRQTSGALEVRYDDVVVWHVDAYPETKDPGGVHLAFVRPLGNLENAP